MTSTVNTNCRVCENAEHNRVFTAREMMFGLRDTFTYFECAHCGCVQIAQIPADLSKYYPKEYYSYQKDSAMKALLKRKWAAFSYGKRSLLGGMMTALLGQNHAVASVRRAQVPPNADTLDVGCGGGDLLLLLRALGFTSLKGADPFIAEDIRYPNGVEVWKKDLGQLSSPFDVIMLHHSFEHMARPVETLTQASQLLRPGGMLLIRLPVAGSYAWRTYGADWVQLDAPRHIFLPSVRSMQLLSQKTGMELGDIVFDSTELQFWGSEQYRRDNPLHDARSLISPSRQLLAFRQMRQYRSRAEELNAKGDGDSACFYLRHRPIVPALSQAQNALPGK